MMGSVMIKPFYCLINPFSPRACLREGRGEGGVKKVFIYTIFKGMTARQSQVGIIFG
jgi:hypothetical protein